jgi:hypothetical protein
MKDNNNDKYFLEASIEIQKETEVLKEAAASVINLPKDNEKQPDLLYFTAIFVSSGCNLNKAYFLPSELIKAEGTIINKALDIEHKESEIIGHIYDRAFTDIQGNHLDINELASLETSSLDKKDMHIQIAGIIYKNRFPDIAKEVSEGKWKVSMESYFTDYDVKIGDTILSKKEAESLGLSINDAIGKSAKIIKNGLVIASGTVIRVLRNLLFSGCGIVENPANPPSVILEVAKDNNTVDDEIIVLNYNEQSKDNNVTSTDIDSIVINQSGDSIINEQSALVMKDTIGICVSFKKYVYANDNTVIHEQWCTKYDTGCTSFGGEATSPDCLRNKVESAAVEIFDKFSKGSASIKRIDKLVSTLKSAFKNASKFL